MSREYPDLIDPDKVADGRRDFQGTMSLRRMERLKTLLAPEPQTAVTPERGVAWNDVRFKARFGHDRQGAVTVDLQVEAELPLICQRSLEPYLEPVRRRSILCVVKDEIEVEDVPEAYDPVLLTEGKLALLDLVEDELLLAVPQVPRNPAVEAVKLSTDGEVTSSPETNDGRSQRPFAELADLLEKKARD